MPPPRGEVESPHWGRPWAGPMPTLPWQPRILPPPPTPGCLPQAAQLPVGRMPLGQAGTVRLPPRQRDSRQPVISHRQSPAAVRGQGHTHRSWPGSQGLTVSGTCSYQSWRVSATQPVTAAVTLSATPGLQGHTQPLSVSAARQAGRSASPSTPAGRVHQALGDLRPSFSMITQIIRPRRPRRPGNVSF